MFQIASPFGRRNSVLEYRAGNSCSASVAIAGTTVVVGARRDDAGSAYVFEIPPEPAPGPHCWILKER